MNIQERRIQLHEELTQALKEMDQAQNAANLLREKAFSLQERLKELDILDPPKEEEPEISLE
tara:strand:+ start:27 stop:212 length:186 start_codon:yes stop_codon:yes gene_type:complete